MIDSKPTTTRPSAPTFACPRCDRPLLAQQDGHECRGCKTFYPRIDGVPWLFAEPQAALTEWRLRIDAHVADLNRKAAQAKAALRQPHLPLLTTTRLEYLSAGYTRQSEVIAQLLRAVQPVTAPIATATHLALKTRLPPAQGLASYHANLHRDWHWGDEENRLSYELVAAALDTGRTGPQLVLGAGAGRLAYDLAVSGAGADVTALDLNPLMMLAARRLAAGETLQQVEFPLAPRTADCVAVTRDLAAPTPTDRLNFVLADALRPPFAAESFGTIVTPWFIDVVDEDLSTLARRINGLLTIGGRWVVFGSVAFEHPDPSRCYTVEEVRATIAGAGYEVGDTHEAEIPYLCSPASRHARRELVIAVGATKCATVAAPPRHVALPEWLTQNNRPVPLLESFKLQAMTTRIYAFLMSMIDGQRSVNDMAQLMEAQQLMPRREAETAIRGFLIKMFDEANTPPR
jgi:uncharacterized protein YbaR (Trm112 family)